MEKCFNCIIDENYAGKTVKQLLTGRWQLGSAQIKKAKFREDGITVDGKRVTVRYELSLGEKLSVRIEDKEQGSSHLVPIEGEVSVLYEDEDVICVDKPAGRVCHPSAGHYADSMANLMVGYFLKRGEHFTVRLLGRLDKDTSGVLIYAKHAPALLSLSRQRDEGLLHKTYLAILSGCVDFDTKIITTPIVTKIEMPLTMGCAREGMEAETHVRVLWKDKIKKLTLCAVTIMTGRTHQIRVHMADMGYPLVGDLLYGKDDRMARHALHAVKLTFIADGEKKDILSPLPPDLDQFLLENGCRIKELKENYYV